MQLWVRGGGAAIVLGALSAFAAAPAQTVKLAAPGLSWVNIPPDVATFFGNHLAQQISQNGVKVITQEDIASVLGLEQQKALLGCSQSSCMAELASALGADGVLIGSIGKFQSSYQVNIKIVSTRDATALSSQSFKVKGDEELLDQLGQVAKIMAREVSEKLGRPLADAGRANDSSVASSGGGSSSNVPAWVLTGGGTGVFVAGAIFYGLAISAASQLRSATSPSAMPPPCIPKARATRSSASSWASPG